MYEKIENEVKELSKEEMEHVQGGAPTLSSTLTGYRSGVVAEAGAQTGFTGNDDLLDVLPRERLMVLADAVDY